MRKPTLNPVEINPIELAQSTLHCNQAQLAEKVGVTPAVIHMWKTRRAVSTKYLRKMCEVTGLPPYLLNPHVPAFVVPPAPEETDND